MCHFIGVVVAAVSAAMLVIGVVLVCLFHSPSLEFSLGLGAFGVGGFLGILFLGYMCATLKKKWKVFGCCGKWKQAEGGVASPLEEVYTESHTESDRGFVYDSRTHRTQSGSAVDPSDW